MSTTIEVGMDHVVGQWCVTTVVAGEPLKRFWDDDIDVVVHEANMWCRLYQGEIVLLMED